jgi:GTP-binding protein
MFVDYVEVEVQAGNGGNGVVSFRRLKFVAKGGPDGGDGGRGGDVWLEVDENLMTLMDIKYRRKYSAERGGDGSGNQKSGRAGKSVTIRVPPGTAVYDAGHKEDLLTDLTKHCERFCAAKGGKGGLGNVNFKSPTNQAPRKSTPGKPGERRRLILELRLIADVGLVGYPNAGKSTILAALSDAKPKIASYPFTTLTPNIGTVSLDNYTSFRLADIPGIIEGASKGKGLGLAFLRHIMRTRLLLFVIDGSAENASETLTMLRRELMEFDWRLAERPSIVTINKSDLLDSRTALQIRDSVSSDCLITSGLTGEGLSQLKTAIAHRLGINDRPE